MTTKSASNKPSRYAPPLYHPRPDASARQMVLRARPSIRAREVSAFVPDDRDNPLSADPRLFRNQVQRGASFPIVDWLSFWAHVMSTSGELVDLEKRFKTALAYQQAHPEIEQALEPVRNRPNCYMLRISPTSEIFIRAFNDRLFCRRTPKVIRVRTHVECPK